MEPEPIDRATSLTVECKIDVPYRFPLVFTHDVFGPDNPVLAETLAECRHHGSPSVVRVWIDQGLVGANPAIIERCRTYLHRNLSRASRGDPAVFPGGESVKTGWKHINEMLRDLQRNGLCRHSYLIAIGGGAFLDAAGFSAALFHRGVRLVRMPSTTLSQNDSGVGVKNGINLNGCKNILGTFAPPAAVINDLDLLDTLDPYVMRDGVAEAIKVAIIQDRPFFEYIERHAADLKVGRKQELYELVRRCAMLHLNHIQSNGDPFETGSARPLDFGHWSAHRLEAMSNYTLRHGQGVAIGIALDSYYAQKKSLISSSAFKKIISAITCAGLPVYLSLLSKRNRAGDFDVLAGIEQFREHLGGNLSITLPAGLGNKVEVSEMDIDIVRDGIDWLAARHTSP